MSANTMLKVAKPLQKFTNPAAQLADLKEGTNTAYSLQVIPVFGIIIILGYIYFSMIFFNVNHIPDFMILASKVFLISNVCLWAIGRVIDGIKK